MKILNLFCCEPTYKLSKARVANRGQTDGDRKHKLIQWLKFYIEAIFKVLEKYIK
ncbi:hypothetical protein [Chlorogloeopsis sp. ULAP02]|uniref:hypothetical protein n=1 Tax=Chlorogloeopsis sp. ULAP02 TaxID=3107926 RepID=UPI0031364092